MRNYSIIFFRNIFSSVSVTETKSLHATILLQNKCFQSSLTVSLKSSYAAGVITSSCYEMQCKVKGKKNQCISEVKHFKDQNSVPHNDIV